MRKQRFLLRHGKPKPGSSGRIIDDGVPRRSTEILADSLPCEDDESEEVARSKPEVALVCWRNRPVVRKTKF